MIQIKEGKVKVSSRTPRIANLNRQQRRALIYTSKGQRLAAAVTALRKEMHAAGIKTTPPKFTGRKRLSGYMGALKTKALFND